MFRYMYMVCTYIWKFLYKNITEYVYLMFMRQLVWSRADHTVTFFLGELVAEPNAFIRGRNGLHTSFLLTTTTSKVCIFEKGTSST